MPSGSSEARIRVVYHAAMTTRKNRGSKPVEGKPDSALNDYQVDLIHKGTRQAEAGERVEHSEVERLVWRMRLRTRSYVTTSRHNPRRQGL